MKFKTIICNKDEFQTAVEWLRNSGLRVDASEPETLWKHWPTCLLNRPTILSAKLFTKTEFMGQRLGEQFFGTLIGSPANPCKQGDVLGITDDFTPLLLRETQISFGFSII